MMVKSNKSWIVLTFLTFLIVFGLTEPFPAEPQKKRIIMFSPTSKNNTYWPQVYRILEAASEDLHIDFRHYKFSVEDRFAKHIEGVNILKEKPYADGAIFCVAFGQTRPLLKTADNLNIATFIQGPLFESELSELGGDARRTIQNWIGYFYQNEKEKGYLLGKTLINAAISENAYAESGMVNVVGVGGDHTWFGSKLRAEGLKKAVSEEPKAKLKQIVSTQWSPSEGYQKTKLLLERYPQTSVVWAASDQLAIGAYQALQDGGKVLGETGFTGGLDMSKNGLKEVKNGNLVATVSSTLFSYAEILIYLYDYLNDIDFKNETGTTIQTDIYIANQKNAGRYLSLFNFFGKIDFKNFSKAYNPQMKEYRFSMENYIKAAGITD